MAQDFKESGRPITTKSVTKKEKNSDKLYPKDMVTVYSTDVLLAAGIPSGTKMEVHSNLAKKMLEQKKVTETEPEEKKATKKEEVKK